MVAAHQNGGLSMTESLKRARALMWSTLELLDDCDAPIDVGAHLDLAICRLDDALQIPNEQLNVSAPAVRRTCT